MSACTIAVIVGSLRKESFNRKLAQALTRLAGDKWNATFLNIGALPLYNQDMEQDFPVSVTRFKEDIMDADGILFVTPEYNRSVPGPLKNAIDWASRPYGKNAFAGKPAALCGTSQSSVGTACSQHALHSVFTYLDMQVLGQPEVYLQFKEGLIDDNGAIANPGTEKFLQGFVDTFTQWVARHANAQANNRLQKKAG